MNFNENHLKACSNSLIIFCSPFQPGCVNTTEVDIKKACRMNRHSKMSRVSTSRMAARIMHQLTDEDDYVLGLFTFFNCSGIVVLKG